MILADAHLHLFRRGFPGMYGRSLLAPEVVVYESLRKAHAIKAGLVVGYEGEGIDPDNNAFIRSLAADRPWMATAAYVDAQAARSPDRVAALFDDGHVGVALYISDAAGARAIAAWPAATWRALDQRCAIVSLNAAPEFVSTFAAVAEQSQRCTFLVSHMGLPGSYRVPPGAPAAAERLGPLLRMASLPNVMVKLSAPYAISDPAHAYPHEAARPFVDVILDRFGPERCLWGSDFSPALDHVSFAQTVANPWLDRLGDADRAAVMGANLLLLLGRRSVSGP